MEKRHIVLFGGDSYEHEISIISAIQCMKRYKDCIPVYIALDGTWYMGDNLKELDSYRTGAYKKNKEVTLLPNSQYLYCKKGRKWKQYVEIEDALCVFHGNIMEGGAIAGLLELNQIPYSCSSILGSSLVQSKAKCEYTLLGMGVERLPFLVVQKDTYYADQDHMLSAIEEGVGFPLILKPSSLGSSIGISVVKEKAQLEQALQEAFDYDEEVLVQTYLEDMKEINIALYRYQGELHLSKMEEPLKKEEILSFADKYQQGGKEGMRGLTRILDPAISKEQQEEIETLAKYVYNQLSLSGVVRIDFMIDNLSGRVYLNEINNIPGSLAYYLFDLPYEELLHRMMIEAHRRADNKSKKEVRFAVLNTLSDGKLGKLQK